jgi:uncharacterized membrane protein
MANPGPDGGGLSDYSLKVPTPRAVSFVVGFLILAFLLYMVGGKSWKDYAVKVADFMMQGAIIIIFFAILAKGLNVRLTRTR